MAEKIKEKAVSSYNSVKESIHNVTANKAYSTQPNPQHLQHGQGDHGSSGNFAAAGAAVAGAGYAGYSQQTSNEQVQQAAERETMMRSCQTRLTSLYTQEVSNLKTELASFQSMHEQLVISDQRMKHNRQQMSQHSAVLSNTQELDANIASLNSWVEKHQNMGPSHMSLEELLEPQSERGQQLLEALALKMACGDALEAVWKQFSSASEERDVKALITVVRELAKRQFEASAQLKKLQEEFQEEASA